MLKFKWEIEFKDTEIGEVPKDWEVEKLGWAVKSLETGNRPKGGSLQHDPNGVLSIGGENISWDGDLILDNCLRFAESFYNSLKKGKIKEKDILLIKDGATIGKLAFIKNVPEGKAMVNEHVFLIRTNEEKYHSRFLFYFLFSNAGQTQIESSIGGSAQGGINKGILETIKIPKFDLNEQSRIAIVLSWFDDLIENKKRQNEILEKVAMAIFKSWFVNFEPFKDEKFVYNKKLGKEIPKGWEVKPIGEVVDILYGRGLPESRRKNGSFPVVGSSGIVGYHAQFLATPPSIVVGRKGNVGSVYLMLEPFYPIDTVFYTGKTTPAKTFYIYHYLKLTPLAEIGMTDTAVPGININNLKAVKFPLPPQPILQRFHSLVEPIFQKIILNQKQIMVLRKIKDALLPKLVFGKLRVVEI